MFDVIFLICTILYLAYYFVRRRYSYWERAGIPYVQPKFPYGSVKTLGTVEHSSQLFTRLYNDFKGQGKYVGIYMFLSPAIITLDIDFVKTILVKEFQYFVNRGMYYNEKDDPVSAHLFNLEDQKWRNLRTKLSPTFTSGKMKFMFPTIVGVSVEFQKCISRELKSNAQVEMKDLLARYTTDVIGTCAFGLDCNSLVDPYAQFRVEGRRIFEDTKYTGIPAVLLQTFPNVGRAFHICHLHKSVTDFFSRIIRDTIEYRERSGEQRNDFMNLLMQLKNKGKLDDDETETGKSITEITVDEITAQAFIFFSAGFETSSTTMGYALYELAQNQEMQERARKEVRDVLEKYNGELSYEACLEMKYIDQIINGKLALLNVVDKNDYIDIFFFGIFQQNLLENIPQFPHCLEPSPKTIMIRVPVSHSRKI